MRIGIVRRALVAFAALYLASLVGGEVYSTVLQRFVVTPNEQTREAPFIRHNIDATRHAFGIDHVEERDLTGDAMLSQEAAITMIE